MYSHSQWYKLSALVFKTKFNVQITTPKGTLGDIFMSDHRARGCRVNDNNPLRGTVACSPMRAFTLLHVEEKHKIVYESLSRHVCREGCPGL